jgi:hypothetical protein
MSPFRKRGGKKGRQPKADPLAEARLKRMEDALAGAGVPLRYDRRIAGRGGLCRVEGEWRVILNGSLSPVQKAEAILEVLREVSPEEAERLETAPAESPEGEDDVPPSEPD